MKLTTPTPDREPDDLDRMRDEEMKNPEFRAAYEDARIRHTTIWTLLQQRKASGLTVEQVAERMGVKVKRVREYENGSTDPYLSFHQRYARAVGARLCVDVEVGDSSWSKTVAAKIANAGRSHAARSRMARKAARTRKRRGEG